MTLKVKSGRFGKMQETADGTQKPKLKNTNQNEFKVLRDYFQPIVDIIRKHTNNIVLIPGLWYESQFSGFTEYTFEGTNIGFTTHCYPGWFNSPAENDETKGYEEFKEEIVMIYYIF